MAARDTYVAVRGVGAEALAEALGDLGYTEVVEAAEWAATLFPSLARPAGDTGKSLAALGAPYLVAAIEGGEGWGLTLGRGDDPQFHTCHDFTVHHDRDSWRQALKEVAADGGDPWRELIDSGFFEPALVRSVAAATDLGDPAAGDGVEDWPDRLLDAVLQAETRAIKDALDALGLAYDADALADALAGRVDDPDELESDHGNLPHFLAALDLPAPEDLPARSPSPTATRTSHDRVATALIVGRHLATLEPPSPETPPAPLEPAPLETDLQVMPHLYRLAMFLDVAVHAQLYARLPDGVAVPSRLRHWKETDEGLSPTLSVRGRTKTTLESLLGLSRGLTLPTGSELELRLLLERRLLVEQEYRTLAFVGPVDGRAWSLAATRPSLDRSTLRQALDLARSAAVDHYPPVEPREADALLARLRSEPLLSTFEFEIRDRQVQVRRRAEIQWVPVAKPYFEVHRAFFQVRFGDAFSD